MDPIVTAFDLELFSAFNWGGASLTLVRHGGANAQDVFSAMGSLASLTEGAPLIYTGPSYTGTTIGTVTTNSGGTLVLTFDANAVWQHFIDGSLRSIAYSNTADDPVPAVQLDWRFSDGNTGAQGPGGPLTATGSTTVTIVDVHAGSPGPNALTAGTGPDRFDYGNLNQGLDTIGGFERGLLA